MAKHYFHIGDFIVFGATIVISLAIGIYYALSGGRQRTTSEYLVGGRSMSVIPTAISLLVSFESSIMMLGLPAEAYVYGIQIVLGALGSLIANLLSIHIVVPLLHPLRITSAYEYLELRFRSRWVRLVGTLMGMLTYDFAVWMFTHKVSMLTFVIFVWYMGIVLFGPAVALEAVTDFPLWSSIFVIELVAVIYTAFGGLKAVIWTDVFQAIVMFSGIFAILIKGTIDAGGPKAVWYTAEEGGRLNFFNFDPDPRTRHTFWTLFVGAIFRGFGLGFNQSTVQRISSTKTTGEAKKMLFSVAPSYAISLIISTYEGTVAYAYYQAKRCDPFESKAISDPNQIVPYMVMDIFEYLPGMPGLFLASLFSASLSTLSSGLSSLSALLWADVVHPIVGPNISEFKATLIAKAAVLLYGGLACGIAVLVSQIGGPLTQISGSMIAAFGGPLIGIFFLGCFCPRCNDKGAIAGGFSGLALAFWISLGMNFSPAIRKTPWLPPASIANCSVPDLGNGTDVWLSSVYNSSDVYSIYSIPKLSTVMTTTVNSYREPEGVEKLYTVSYQWISVLGTMTTMVVGLLVSILTGMNRPGDVDPRYLISFSESIFIFLPRPIKKFLSSLGPQYMKEEYKARFPDPAKRLNLDTELEVKPTDKENIQTDVNDEESDPFLDNNVKHANSSEINPTNHEFINMQYLVIDRAASNGDVVQNDEETSGRQTDDQSDSKGPN